jgi:hypothetical protein
LLDEFDLLQITRSPRLLLGPVQQPDQPFRGGFSRLLESSRRISPRFEQRLWSRAIGLFRLQRRGEEIRHGKNCEAGHYQQASRHQSHWLTASTIALTDKKHCHKQNSHNWNDRKTTRDSESLSNTIIFAPTIGTPDPTSHPKVRNTDFSLRQMASVERGLSADR